MTLPRFQNLREFLFSNTNLRQTVFKNTFWLTISNLSGRLIRAVLLIYVARILGAAGYGVFSYAVGISALFSVFSDIGITGVLIREGAREPEALPDYLGTSFILKLFLLALSVAAMLILTPHINHIPEAAPLIPLAALLILFDALRDFAVSVSRAEEKMHMEALIMIVTNLAITGLGIALIFLHPTPRALMAGYTLGSALGMILAFWILRKPFLVSVRRFKKDLVKPILAAGIPFGIVGILASLMLQTDTVMLGYYTNAAAVGLYAAAQRPILVLYIIPGILAGALFPAMSRLAESEEDRFRLLLERGLTFSFMLTLPLFFGGLALGHNLILFLFGRQFEGAALSFLILLGTILINYPASIIGNALFARNKQNVLLISMTLGALANAFFNYLFIPRWGIAGSAVSTIVAQILMNSVTWWYLKHVHPFRTLTYIWKILIASLIMAGGAAFLNHLGVHVLLNISVMALAYFALLILFKEETLHYFKPKGLMQAGGVSEERV